MSGLQTCQVSSWHVLSVCECKKKKKKTTTTKKKKTKKTRLHNNTSKSSRDCHIQRLFRRDGFLFERRVALNVIRVHSCSGYLVFLKLQVVDYKFYDFF